MTHKPEKAKAPAPRAAAAPANTAPPPPSGKGPEDLSNFKLNLDALN